MRPPNQVYPSSCALLLASFLAAGLVPGSAARETPDFNLLDIHGQNHELHRAGGHAVVLFFTGVGCPVARKSAPKLRALKAEFEKKGVEFWVVDTYADDSGRDVLKEASELELWSFTYLRDPRQGLALSLGVERTAEVVAISTRDWKVFYQGAIDDQLSEGAERPAAKEKFLEAALADFLAGRPVATVRTKAHGCRLSFAEPAEASQPPSYSSQVAPILQAHCVQCHREGAIAPWAMSSHERVKNYARMMQEVLLARRMPPWDADPDYGHFRDVNRLTREEFQTLLRWADAGAPRGDGPDPLTAPLPPIPEWSMGQPDVVLRLPEAQEVPATGVVDYRHVKVQIPLTNEVWISGIDIHPGNRKVLHHVILYAKWPGSQDDTSGNGVHLAGWAPGVPAVHYPKGLGKRLPPNAELTFELHYTTCGSPQTDQTEAGIYFWPEPQSKAVETRRAAEWNLELPPGSEEARHVATYGFRKPATIYGLAPHMHLRGKWMRYELLLPNGSRETILNVPRYDFNWQLGYALAEPRHVPAGSWLLVTGAFDNSPGNPANPDASLRVHAGRQSWEEMFIGFFDAADDLSESEPNLTSTSPR